MFHELGHGLGLERTLGGRELVRDALKDEAYAVEEAKADAFSLAMITQLHEWGELSAEALQNVYATSLANIFRHGIHGRQAVTRLDFFRDVGAYSRDAGTGTYRVHSERARPSPIQPTCSQARGRAEVFAEFAEGPQDIEGFSHLILLYAFHRVAIHYFGSPV